MIVEENLLKKVIKDFGEEWLKYDQTDALDSFGTRLEHRFEKKEILEIMNLADLDNIVFSKSDPFWYVYGIKK
jgi:hypothetical protein